MKKGKIAAISVSGKKGVKKANVPQADLKENFGIVGDAHGGSDRQLSLLAAESIEKMRQKGLTVGPGDFAENITTEGLEWSALDLGTRIKLGEEAVVEISQFGKECTKPCAIYYQAGDCVMPREGVFARVIKPGHIRPGDTVEVM